MSQNNSVVAILAFSQVGGSILPIRPSNYESFSRKSALAMTVETLFCLLGVWLNGLVQLQQLTENAVRN